MSMAVIAAHKKELKAFDTSKGTIRFTVDRPLPSTLVKSIVRKRLAQNQARREAKARK